MISFPKYFLKTSGKCHLHAGIDISKISEVHFKITSQIEPARLRKHWENHTACARVSVFLGWESSNLLNKLFLKMELLALKLNFNILNTLKLMLSHNDMQI